VHRLAPEYHLDPRLVVAVIEVESGFNPKAKSPKGAMGLMQLMPETARRFGVKNPWDPLQNLRGGMAYLRWLLDRFDGDLALVLASYNAGEKAVERYRGVPPFGETRRYVQRITRSLEISRGGT
jgi:soluble lytic murein transglycosylase-like protein